MNSGKNSAFNVEENLEIGNASASASRGTPRNSPAVGNNVECQSPLALGTDLPRASDLLMSVSVGAEVNKPKITKLAMSAMKELLKLALDRAALWVLDIDSGAYVLNNAEYKRRFGPLDPTLEEIVTMINTEGPFQLPELNDSGVRVSPTALGPIHDLQAEASIDTGLVHMNPLNLCAMFMDVEQWALFLSSIVSEAKVIEVLVPVEEGNLNGALQVMTAGYHLPSPLVQTRESYFVRYCRCLSLDTWVVADVSLESIFPNPATRYVRRPSGCVIQAMGDGFSKVTWIEHVEVDNSSVHCLFRPLVSSGFAFSAQRWVGTLERQCGRLGTYMDDRVTVMQDARQSIIKLAGRMMRSFHAAISPTQENIWMPLPADGAGGDIMVTTRYNIDDPEIPRGVSITVATTIWLPALPTVVFDFLRDGKNRSKWDLLCLSHPTTEMARLTTNRDLKNYVSIVAAEDASPLVFYLQESQCNSTGSYVVYAPVDIFAMNLVLGGGSPDGIQLLSSGFAVLPDRPTMNMNMNMNGEVEMGGTLLTIAFQIMAEGDATPEYVPPKSVAGIYTIISETASLVRAAVIQ